MSLHHITDDFRDFANRHEFQKRLAATQIVAVANQIAAGRFKALFFRAGTLTVAIKSHTDRYLLEPDLGSIIAQINKELGQDKIKKIKFRQDS